MIFTKINESINKNCFKNLIFIFFIFTLFYSIYSVTKHNNFGSFGHDLGIYDQTVWKYSNLSGTYNTVLEVKNLLGDHFELILVPLSLAYKILSDVRVLLVIQAAAICSAIFPLYSLIFQKLKQASSSLILVLSYLIFFGIQSAVDFDFHPIVLAVPLLITALYFLEKNKYIPSCICLLVALACKESVTLYIVFFGIYALFTRKNRYYSFGLIILGISAFYFLTKLLMPAVSGQSYRYFQYSKLGNSLNEAVVNIIFHPLRLIKTLLSPQVKIDSMLILFGSTSFLIIAGGFSLILIVPMIAERFLSDRETSWSPFYHYSATIAPFLFYLSAVAIYNLRQKIKYKYLTVLLSLLVLVSTVAIGCIGFEGRKAPVLQNSFSSNFWHNSNTEYLNHAISLIDKTSSVTASNNIVPHLSHRNEIYLFPDHAFDTKYIVISMDAYPYPISNTDINGYITKLNLSLDYTLLYQHENTYLYEKK